MCPDVFMAIVRPDDDDDDDGPPFCLIAYAFVSILLMVNVSNNWSQCKRPALYSLNSIILCIYTKTTLLDYSCRYNGKETIVIIAHTHTHTHKRVANSFFIVFWSHSIIYYYYYKSVCA